jgi:phospholipase C
MQPCLFKRLFAVLTIGLAFTVGTSLFAQQAPTPFQQAVSKYSISPQDEPKLSSNELIQALRQKVQYVFVFYQENRSFDSLLGTFPNAEGLFTNPPQQTPGFYQKLMNTDGTMTTIHPFRIGPSQFAADTDDMDHGHSDLIAKMDIQGVPPTPLMDLFALAEENIDINDYGSSALQGKQAGELTMAYEDCDTVPLLWGYAKKFVLFDHIFQEMIGPSTPGNLSILGAQTGVTQWALHPGDAPSVPVLSDPDPFWGSLSDSTPAPLLMPVNPYDMPEYGTLNLTYATLPLTLLGGGVKGMVAKDMNPAGDLFDVDEDVNFINSLKQATVPFGWYQEGYDLEPTDPPGTGPAGTHVNYVTHHNAPQYFGYISNNLEMRKQLHGLQDFFNAVDNKALPRNGGVFFIKGGYQNNFGLLPANPNPTVQSYFVGDDEHPGYSDAQISEAMVAEGINRIAASPYWARSAIIITYDDSEGDYDHVPPPLLVKGPDGSWISDGPRVPLVLISPYASTNTVVQSPGNHASVPKFIAALFNLPPLATLPDEESGRQLGLEEFGQTELGPQDAITPHVTDLLGAFSPSRLTGKALPLPPEYVQVPESLVLNLPQSTGYGCKDLGIITTDRAKGIVNQIPADFNQLPFTLPTPTN